MTSSRRQVIPMMSFRHEEDEKDDEEDEEEDSDSIEWRNVVFLPFHPIFRFVVLCVVVIKIVVSPIESLYPFIYCSEISDYDVSLTIIKYFYLYICDITYVIDTFLYIVHRLADISKRREHLPKSKFCIMLDIISLIPFYRLLTSDNCLPIQIWPNVLNMIDIVIIYRIENYFSLSVTHNFWSIVIGYTLIFLVATNFMSCLFVLITHEFNTKDATKFFDWRKYLIRKINATDLKHSSYIKAMFMSSAYALNHLSGVTKASSVTFYYIITLIMIMTYLVLTFLAYPKAFAESMLKMRRSFEFFPRVQRIVAETQRRNHTAGAATDVSNFYNLIWNKRDGITTTPEIIVEFPRHLRLDIKMDLTWPIFYHSPTLRRVSMPFIHWLCDLTHLDFKLPNENFFASPHCRTHLCYLKSGIVQLISSEDGTTPLLSMTSGTIFGDINFFLPPTTASKPVIVRCMTYCELYFFTRADILKALHKFPEDRKQIMERIKKKIKHARTLYTCKQNIRGLDRVEDEGLSWIKRRWWDINESYKNWKKTSTKVEIPFEFPPEEFVYHCSKYIGQLVLCRTEQLQKHSIFSNYQFPWILAPDSNFHVIWQRIVTITVVLVLILYPPNLTLSVKPDYFLYFQAWTQIVYIADICLSLMTAIEDQGHLLSSFASVMFKRCKSLNFSLALLATTPIEDFIVFIGKPELYSICQFNKLIKFYVVFYRYKTIKDVKTDPGLILYLVPLLYVSFVYISGYFIMALVKIEPKLSMFCFFGAICGEQQSCDLSAMESFRVSFTWAFRDLYVKTWPATLEEFFVKIIVAYLSLIISVYCAGRILTVIFFKNKHSTDFMFFAINIRQKFKQHYVHPQLSKRLTKYLLCYWKYNRTLEETDASLLKHEPYDIYWKAHGEIAAEIIMMCKAFVGANPALIKELAHVAKFMILPKHATLLLTGVPVKDVCWLVKGVIVREYQTETGVATEQMYGPDARLVSCSVFFGKPSLVTCTSLTECEMLSISKIDFFRVISHYPSEKLHIKSCTEKYMAAFNEMAKVNLAAQTVDQWNEIGIPSKAKEQFLAEHAEIPMSNWKHPGSKFMQYWMAIRAIIVTLDIITATLQGGVLAAHRRALILISAACDCFTICDVIIKCLHAYYDTRGILIYSKLKCMAHYCSRGLMLDVICLMPWDLLPELFPMLAAKDRALLIHAWSKYARVHLLLGYFDYIADSPVAPVTLLMIIKWQLFTIFLLFSTCHYLIVECVHLNWNDHFELVGVKKRGRCWLPNFIRFSKQPTKKQFDMVVGESFNLAQSGFLGIDNGVFNIADSHIFLGIMLNSLTVINWSVYCYSVAMLVLSRRGSALFQHAFHTLDKFLHAERLDDKLIERSLAHFSYWWTRTNGVNIYDDFIHKRISTMFRLDLVYFFYKQTFSGLDMLLNGGDHMMKQLSCVGSQYYMLPGVRVMREMDLNPWVYVVHRGEVVITQERRTLAVLKKGSIFGQLEGTEHRPVRVSAHTTGYTDIVCIPVGAFQENIDDKVRCNIHRHPTSSLDYMQVKDPPKENPYNTVKYFLGVGKAIQMPWMDQPVKSHLHRGYSCWLWLVWFVAPFVSAAIVIILPTLPLNIIYKLLVILILLDILHLAHFVSEFYTLELVIIDDECVHRLLKLRKFKEWQTYLDIVSLILPMMTIFTNNWTYQLARLFRLRSFYDFYKYFCQDFKSQKYHSLIDFAIISLIVHSMMCGWIVIACRPSVLTNSYYIPKFEPAEGEYRRYYKEWVDPSIRKEGCNIIVFEKHQGLYSNHSFLVPLRWQDDYAMAIGFIISIFTRTNSGNYAALTRREMYYKCAVGYICNIICIWVSSSAIRAMYLRYRELLNFDYNTDKLFNYMQHNGLHRALLQELKDYTKLLWQRQRGSWMPELVLEAPLCLREDLYVALYSYHLQDIPLFRAQPAYFTRQLATRLHRVVICPGRTLLQAGDIFGCIVFIHDGEVEKWYSDSSGDKRMVSLLTTNGFFGVIPGLFPDTPVQFTFVTRTVCDMVVLRYRDWQDLLEGYPEIKRDLYEAAKNLKKDLGKT